MIRKVLQDNAAALLDARFPGKKKIPRKKLYSIGVFDEVSADGHEKLGEQALQMGEGIGIPIYGFKDKFSNAALFFVVVPNARLATTISHVYLDFVQSFGGNVISTV